MKTKLLCFLGSLFWIMAPSCHSFVSNYPGVPRRSLLVQQRQPQLRVATELETELETEIIAVEIGADDGVMMEAYTRVESSLVEEDERPEYDEFDLADAIMEKWQERYDVNLTQDYIIDDEDEDGFDFQNVYLNVLPLFQQESEYDYLMDLDAIVKVLREHDQLRDYVLMSIYQIAEHNKKIEEFDGYALRDALRDKWGDSYDMDFQPMDTFGIKRLYLNVLPFRYGTNRCRFKDEYDYLCHLQGVVELLQEYGQLEEVLEQIAKTDEEPITRRQSLLVPRPGVKPSVAVSLELDLDHAQLERVFES